ncbi:MAG: hypothetical protein RLZZ43_891, partial [Actinomycetota bacterium]
MSNMFEIENLRIAFNTKRGELKAVRGVT